MPTEGKISKAFNIILLLHCVLDTSHTTLIKAKDNVKRSI